MKRADGLRQFYSRTFPTSDPREAECFLDREGEPTTDYPHVHVTFYRNGNVEILPSFGPGQHGRRIQLVTADGREVERAIQACASLL